MLGAWCFYHLDKFFAHFLPTRFLLEACSLRLVSSPDDLPFIVMIGPKGFHCRDKILSSPWSDLSWPWLAFVISKLIFIVLLYHLIVASLWLWPSMYHDQPKYVRGSTWPSKLWLRYWLYAQQVGSSATYRVNIFTHVVYLTPGPLLLEAVNYA